MNKKIRVGIIGCGNIAGWNELDRAREKPCTHLGAYRGRKDVEVAGCCDKDITRAAKFAERFDIDFHTDSINSLLSRRIDILSICVPYTQHFSVLKSVVNNKHRPRTIFLEKPISDDLSKAKKMVLLCEKNKIRFFVNNRRPSAFYQAFKDEIKTKFDNQILFVSVWCSSGIHAIGIHMIDLLRSICGEVDRVFAFREKEHIRFLPYSHNYISKDPRFCSLLVFRNGVKAAFFNTAKTDFTYFEIEALCRRGRIRTVDNGSKIIYQEKLAPGESSLSYRLDKEKRVRFASRPLFEDLINEIIDGDYAKSPLRAQEALMSYQVIDAMKKSARTHRMQQVRR